MAGAVFSPLDSLTCSVPISALPGASLREPGYSLSSATLDRRIGGFDLSLGASRLEEQATVNVTPHVAKAPWYFLGLQEILAYFNPTVAGIFIPPIYFIGLALIAYVDRSPFRAARSAVEDPSVAISTGNSK